MSIAVMTEVWKDAPVAGTELLMLLALADSCNDDRECWPSVRHLCKKTRLSDRQVRKLLNELTKQKLIRKTVQGGKGAKGRESNLYTILPMTPVIDDKGTSPSTPVTDDKSTPVTDEYLNHHIEPSIKNISPGGSSVDSKSKKQREPNPMYDAIQAVWKYEAARNGQLAKMLQGTSTNRTYKDYNLETPITPEDLRQWAAWWRRENPGLSIIESPVKIQSSITYWQETQKPRVVTDPDMDLSVAIPFDPKDNWK